MLHEVVVCGDRLRQLCWCVGRMNDRKAFGSRASKVLADDFTCNYLKFQKALKWVQRKGSCLHNWEGGQTNGSSFNDEVKDEVEGGRKYQLLDDGISQPGDLETEHNLHF